MLTPTGNLALYLHHGHFSPELSSGTFSRFQGGKSHGVLSGQDWLSAAGPCSAVGIQPKGKYDPLVHLLLPWSSSSPGSLLAPLLIVRGLKLLLGPAVLTCRDVALRRDPSHAAIFPWATCIAGIPTPNVFLFCSRETQYLGALHGSQFLLRSALCNLSC